MARMNTSSDEEREFQVNIIISKDGPCRVIAMERGESGNRTNAETPLGDILGLRECLRMGGLMVRQFFATKQRALDLRAKRDALLAKNRKQEAAPPEPKPMVLGVVTGPLLESDQPMPWCDFCECYHHSTAPHKGGAPGPGLLEVDEITLEKPGPLEPGFQTHSFDGVATVAEDEAIEQWAQELTTEADKVEADQNVDVEYADPKRDALIDAVVAAAHDAIADAPIKQVLGESIPGITTCLECERPLAIVDDVATCINPQCGYYDDAAALRVQRESTRVDKPKPRSARKRAGQ
jgi:hypothetical protein